LTKSTTAPDILPPTGPRWQAVTCLSLMTFVLIASEFMPVSLLTPIAAELGITEGQAGQAIAVSGFFAVITSLFGNRLLGRLDRRSAVLLYTLVMIASGLVVTFAPNGLVFMLGRALIGVTIGGFWSLTAALLTRLVGPADVSRAMAMLQGGTALATVIAAPLGSFLGSVIGWRGAFFVVVPVGVTALLWQWLVLPSLPADAPISPRRMLDLLRIRIFALGMAATALAFMGQFALSTYLRPVLETVTGLEIAPLSLVLLGIGLAGLLGTAVAGLALKRHLALALVGLPLALAILALLMVPAAHIAPPFTALLFLWGLCTTPIPVAWGTWMTRVVPAELEAAGGLQVALIQFAITAGASAGGLLFDHVGWWSAFLLGALLLLGSSLLAITAAQAAKGSSD